MFHKNYETFLITKLRDKLKIDYCSKNNITLYIINYNDVISDKMREILKN